MINLTVDIGNSKTKCSVWDGYTLLFHDVLSNSASASKTLGDLVKQFGIQSVVIANVGNQNDFIKNSLDSIPKENVYNFSFASVKDFRINYSETLGVDRLASFIGAIEMFPSTPLLIVDSGTALTIDIVNSQNEFCGGNISLGLYSRISALHEKTARLPLVKVISPTGYFGKNTEEAILDGAINGIIGEILLCVNKAKELYNIQKVVLTGGEAKFLLPLLKKENIDCVYDEYLVPRGLNSFMQKEFNKRETCLSM